MLRERFDLQRKPFSTLNAAQQTLEGLLRQGLGDRDLTCELLPTALAKNEPTFRFDLSYTDENLYSVPDLPDLDKAHAVFIGRISNHPLDGGVEAACVR